MKYIIIGGDERMLYLYRSLVASGKTAECFAMESAPLPLSAHCEDIKSGDIFILPAPSEKNGCLNAPFSESKLRLSEVFAKLPKNAVVCAGAMSAEAVKAAGSFGIRLYDYMQRPSFAFGNAAITAEAAVEILMNATPRCIAGQRILIIGRGRIGKLLGDKLLHLGADVRFMSGNPASAAEARVSGFKITEKDAALSDLDMVVNTAPAAVLTTEAQKDLRADCVLLELASVSGFDPDAVSHCRLIKAPGLPGKYAPESAAALIAEAVELTVKEHCNE